MSRLTYVEENKINTNDINYTNNIKDFQNNINNSKQYLKELLQNK